MRNKTIFKIVVYVMIASMLLSTVLLTAASFY
ncbi:stressosome-associated protein Prli42 [Paenibacillus sp. S-38]